MNTEIQIPKMFSDLVPLMDGDVAIEHAPLSTRLPQAILADLFYSATNRSDLNYFLLTRRTNLLRAVLDKWIDALDIKTSRTKMTVRFPTGSFIHICNPDELNLNDLPFSWIDRLVVTDAGTITKPLFSGLAAIAERSRIVAGEFGDKETWFYKWARQSTTRLFRYNAETILQTWPDQQVLYDQVVAKMSKDEIKRYMDLKDIEVKLKNVPSYLSWAKSVMAGYCNLPMSDMHRDFDTLLAEITLERKRKDVIVAPRDSAKSTHLAEAYPLYCVCHGLESYILIISDTSEQACKHLEVIKDELENNETIAELYPTIYGQGTVWNNNQIVTRNGICIEALGAGKKIRGRRFRNNRPSLIIGDDLEGDEAAYSAVKREHRRNWFSKGVMKAGGPNSNYLVAGSSIHQECLVAHLHHSPGWNAHVYQAIIKWPDHMDLWEKWERILRDISLDDPMAAAEAFYKTNKVKMNKGAKVLWEERENLYTLMLMRATDGHAAFEAEKQNQPIDPSKCEWSSHLFDNRWFDEWPKEDVKVRVSSLDPSKGKEDKTSDFQAIVTVMIDGKFRCYIDADISRRPMDQMVQRFVTQIRDTDSSSAVCEAEQFQQLLLPEIESAAIEKGVMAKIEPILTKGIPKAMRIRRIGPWINRGRVLFRRGSPGAILLMRQLQEFPNGDHDDGPDALEMALRQASDLYSVTGSKGSFASGGFF